VGDELAAWKSAATLESAKAEGRRELADDALEWLRHEAGK
jgi:hypothetical protein